MTVSRTWVGVALVLLSAMTFSGTSISAVVSYGGGANPATVIVIRFAGAVVVLIGLLRYAGTKIRLKRRDRVFALALGIVQAVQSYFLYTSFEHIPVALTMIIFYIYPLLIGIFASAIGQERLTLPLGGGLVVAFLGLLLVFNVTGDGLNFTGALFAVLAAVAWSLVVVLASRLFSGGDSRPVTLHIQATALLIFVLFLLISGDVQLPQTVRGWTGYLLLPLFYGVAITSFFAATAIIGSVRGSLIMNFEPMATAILGFLILGQTLTPLQLLGGAFVILALFAARWEGG